MGKDEIVCAGSGGLGAGGIAGIAIVCVREKKNNQFKKSIQISSHFL
jgi:hypothetical protein